MIYPVLKSQGYGVMLERARHNPIVMEVVKEMYGDNPQIIDSIKFYYRSIQSLPKLYEMIGFYDRKYAPPLNHPLFELIINKVTQDFKTETVSTRTFDTICESDFTLNTSPGLPYVRMGYRTKAECFDLAVRDAKTLYHSILTGHAKMPWSMIFARTSITTRDRNKLRGVWGKPFAPLILEHLLYRNWLNLIKDNNTTPNGYKYTMFRRGYIDLYDKLTQFGVRLIVGLDFSKYDTSIPPWLLRLSHKIWTSNITMSPFEKKVASFLFKQTIDTTFIMPDGYVFRKDGGTDSGSLGFQRDEDVCTSLMVNFLFALQGREVLFYSVLGDDSICVLDTNQNIDMVKLSEDCKRYFGVEVNVSKSYQTLDVTEAKFLGRYVGRGIPKRDCADFVLSALYPRKTDQDEFELAQRIVALMYENCYMNEQATHFLERVWGKLSSETKDLCMHGKTPWLKQVISMFKTLGLDPPPIVAPPTRMQVFELLYLPKDIKYKTSKSDFFTSDPIFGPFLQRY